MATVTLTITDTDLEDDRIAVGIEHDPPRDASEERTAAQVVALHVVQFIIAASDEETSKPENMRQGLGEMLK